MNSFDIGVVFVLMGSNIALELLLTTMKSLYSLLKGVKGFVKVLSRCFLSFDNGAEMGKQVGRKRNYVSAERELIETRVEPGCCIVNKS